MGTSDPVCPVAWHVIEPDHPVFAGHFPGRPIVPGVVLLDHVLALLHDALDGRPVIAGIPAAKFLQPVFPGALLLVGLEPVAAERLRFVCSVAGKIVAQGTFQLATGSPS